MAMMKKTLVAMALIASATAALAHSGGTNSQGCHTNHSNGSYHCH